MKLSRKAVEFIATGLYLGKIKIAPGTWGTLLGLPLVFLLRAFGPIGYMVAASFSVFIAITIAELHERLTGSHDSGEFVLDEVAGYIVAMTWLPFTWQFLLAGFVIFRILDIAKPFPIGYLDRNLPGGFGTVLDDIAAGLITNVFLQVIFTQTNWLGVTWNGSSLT